MSPAELFYPLEDVSRPGITIKDQASSLAPFHQIFNVNVDSSHIEAQRLEFHEAC